MLAQLVDADPGVFETFVLIATILLIVGLILTVVQNAAATIVNMIGVLAFVAAFLWLT